MKILSKIFLILAYVVLYIPILVLILFSFNNTNNTGAFTGFSLYWYQELFKSPDTFDALKNTLILAVTSSLVATVMGTAAAVGISKMRNKYYKAAVTGITNVPMMNPDIVTGISMMLLFVAIGTVFGLADKLSFFTLLIAHITFSLPYVILSVLPRIEALDKSLPEAACDLGCTPIQSFFKVELPNIMPGVVSSLILSFTLSLDDFVISYFTTGNDFQTLPLLIYSMTKKQVRPDIYALSAIIVVSIFILLLISNILGAKEDKAIKGGKKI